MELCRALLVPLLALLFQHHRERDLKKFALVMVACVLKLGIYMVLGLQKNSAVKMLRLCNKMYFMS